MENQAFEQMKAIWNEESAKDSVWARWIELDKRFGENFTDGVFLALELFFNDNLNTITGESKEEPLQLDQDIMIEIRDTIDFEFNYHIFLNKEEREWVEYVCGYKFDWQNKILVDENNGIKIGPEGDYEDIYDFIESCLYDDKKDGNIDDDYPLLVQVRKKYKYAQKAFRA